MSVPATPAPRSIAVDIARGLTVLCVIVLHVVVGMEAAGLLGYDHPAWVANEPLYMLRMPALALLIGLFISRGVHKRGTKGYLFERTSELVYLYVVWSLILGAIGLVTSDLKNTPRSPAVLWQLWVPQDHLWFLPLLALMTVVLTVLRTWQGRGRLLLGLALALVVSSLTWSRNWDVVGGHGLSLLVFGALGAGLTLDRLTALMARSRTLWAGVLALALVAFLALERAGAVPAAEGQDGAAPGLVLISMLCATAGVVAIIALSRLLADVPGLARGLGYIGRKTMPLFLIHLLFTAGTRIVLLRLGVEDLPTHLVLGTAAGIVGPLLAGLLIDRLGAHWLLALPPSFRARIHAGAGRPARFPVPARA